MEREERVDTNYEAILDKFAEQRKAYTALKAYCKVQEDIAAVEKQRSKKTQECLEKVTESCLMFQNRHKAVVAEMQFEKDNLHNRISELEQQCDRLRSFCSRLNGDANRLEELEDENRVLKTQLAAQEKKQRENEALLKQYFDETQKHTTLLQNGKQTVRNQNSEPYRVKRAEGSKRDTRDFRWPKLNVEKRNGVPANDEEGASTSAIKRYKKRKLFHEDEEAFIEI